MSDIKGQFSEEVSLLRKYSYEFGKSNDMETYKLIILARVALHKMFDDQQAEIQRLNAIIAGTQKVDDVIAGQNEIDAKRWKHVVFLAQRGKLPNAWYEGYTEKELTDSIDEVMTK